MKREDIRTWVADQRAAAAKVAADARKHPMTSAEAFRAALDLLVFDEKMNGDPFARRDPVTEREAEQARAAWSRLRARWRHER